MEELKEKILNAAIEEFADKGLKFTMDDLAKNLRISKKTLYSVYSTKEDMMSELVDYCFADIKKSEKKIAESDGTDLIEKLRQIMIVLPDKYQNIGLNRLYELKEKYPGVYEKVQKHLDTGWEETIRLLEEGMAEGRIRKISIPILKTMFESTIEAFFGTDVLIGENITYEQAMEELIDMIIRGILAQ